MQMSRPYVYTLEELIPHVDFVFIGTPVRPLDELFNVDIPSVPNPTTRSELLKRVYEVEVEIYLKGDAGPRVNVLCNTVKIISQREEDMALIEYVPVPGPVPLTLGQRYLFLVRPFPTVPDKLIRYVLPGRFRLENGMATVESEWGPVSSHYPPMPEAELIQEVQAAIARNP